MNTFYKQLQDETVSINLMSLDEYESDWIGGVYDDSGNGGEKVEKENFICAMTISSDGYRDNDVIDMLAMRGEVWLDSSTGIWLCKKFPPDAPLEARCI